MAGLGVGEVVVILCICGFLSVGLIVVIALAWMLTAGQRSHGDLADLNADDHPHYLTVGRGDPRYANQDHVHALQGLTDVNAAQAVEGDLLMRVGDQWAPRAIPLSGEAAFARDLVRITRADARLYDCWFTLDAPGNQAEVLDLPLSALQVFRETQTGPKFLAKISVEEVEKLRRNQFRIRLRQESDLLRIKFDLVNIPVSNDRTLKSFALENQLQFIGQSPDHTVTVHLQAA